MLAPFHLIGIGGVGMSALARVLLADGIEVSGSDIKDGVTLDALRSLGARIGIGHDASNMGDARTVVVSSAIRQTNPEVRDALDRGLHVLHRAQLLALIARGRRTVSVTGTHGKTTTSAMLATILMRVGLDPTFLVGSEVNEQGTNAHSGRGDIVVAEADESDGSLLWLSPDILVLTNAEAEHLDHYADLDEVLDTFRAAVAQIVPGGVFVACADDQGSASVLETCPEGLVVASYGMDRGAWRINPAGEVRQAETVVATIQLGVPGRHNLRNALAALVAATHLGVDVVAAAEALSTFRGTRRRFEDRGTVNGVRVVDDYAHHPTEVTATLEAARTQVEPGARIVVVFQPHLYSRTAQLGLELGAALARGSDEVAILPIYGSREDPVPGVTGRILLDGALAAVPRRRVAMLPDHSSAVRWAAGRARDGDLVVTMGAGDVTAVGPELVDALNARARAR